MTTDIITDITTIRSLQDKPLVNKHDPNIMGDIEYIMEISPYPELDNLKHSYMVTIRSGDDEYSYRGQAGLKQLLNDWEEV